MSKTITFPFDIGETVNIPELSATGIILSIWHVTRGTEYEVRYFMNGEAKTVYFFEHELTGKQS